jgi:hypothetical protein
MTTTACLQLNAYCIDEADAVTTEGTGPGSAGRQNFARYCLWCTLASGTFL